MAPPWGENILVEPHVVTPHELEEREKSKAKHDAHIDKELETIALEDFGKVRRF